MPIKALASELLELVDINETISQLYRHSQDGPLEGPVWWQEDQCLLFSDVLGDRRLRWTAKDGSRVILEQTNKANGMTRDRQGRLVVCELGGRRVTRREIDGSATVIARGYRGTPLNHPNDIVVKSDGSIYFTDPWSSVPPSPPSEFDLDVCGVYRVSADLGKQTLLIRDMVFPNGLAFSPDEKVLYVNDSRRRHIRAFDVNSDGSLAMATDRIFCDLKGNAPGGPDGMKVDLKGNVYCGGPGGIWVLDQLGTHLGIIEHGEQMTTNIAWGGEDWKTLFFTTHHVLGCIRMKVAGVPVPRG